ncbi:MAG: hypothetical protein ACLQVI_39245 [Polyangiaceae bacterium]
MNTPEIITQMEDLLAEERDAIVRLDGPRVATLAERKLALAQALQAAPPSARAAVSGRMKALVRTLRTNSVLLAQARGILADVLMGPRTTMRGAASASPRLASNAARHLSIRA